MLCGSAGPNTTLLSDNHHNNLCLSVEREVAVVNTTMSTMNDVHQFRVRTPSFLISADNLPVQVRIMVVVVTTLRLDIISR